MANPLTPEEVQRAERLVQNMRATGRKYRNLSPKGRSLLDRYRATLKKGPGPASSPTLSQPPATGLDAPVDRPGGRLSVLPLLATGQKFSYDFEKREYVDEKGQPVPALTKRQIIQTALGGALPGASAVAGEAAAVARTAARVAPTARTATQNVARKANALARIARGDVEQAAQLQARAGRKYGTLKGKVTTPPVKPKMIYDPVRPTFNSLGESAEKVLGEGWEQQFIRARTVADRLKGEQWKRIRDLGLLKLSDQEDEMLRQVLNGKLGYNQVPKRVADLAREFQRQADIHTSFYIRKGQKIFDPELNKFVTFQPVANYSPRVLDFQKLEKISLQQLARDIQAANPNMTGQRAIQIAGSLKGLLTGQRKMKMFERIQKGLGPTHLRSRNMHDLPSSILEPMKTSIPRYLDDASREAAAITQFGANDIAFINAWKQSAHPGRDALWDMYQRFRGWKTPDPLLGGVAVSGRIANNLAAALFLKTSTAVKQFSQVAPAWAKTPTRDMVAGLVKMATKRGRAEAEVAGAFTNDLAEAAFGALRGRNIPGVGGKLLSGTGKAAEAVVKYTGTGPVDRFIRGWVYHAKRRELARLLKDGKTRLLARAGVDVNAPSIKTEVEMVAKEFADKFNLRTDIVSAPGVLSHEAMQFARGLNMFAIQQSKMLYREFLRPAFKPGDFERWKDTMIAGAKFGVYSQVIGELVNDTIAFLTNKKRPQSGARRLAENWAVVGTLGILNPITIGLFGETAPTTTEGVISRMGRNIPDVAAGLVTGAGPRAALAPFEAGAAAASGRPRQAVRLLPVVGDIAQGYLTPPQTRGQEGGRPKRPARPRRPKRQ